MLPEPPGGILELHETFDQGVRREVLEETGLDVQVEHCEDALVVADNDAGDADRMFRPVRHGQPPWSGRWVA